LQVKRACGQARWADKEDEAGDTPSGRRHGDTTASGQQEILGDTVTQGHILIGQLQYMIPLTQQHVLGATREFTDSRSM